MQVHDTQSEGEKMYPSGTMAIINTEARHCPTRLIWLQRNNSKYQRINVSQILMWKGGKEDKMWGNSVARASYNQLVCKEIQEKCPNF